MFARIRAATVAVVAAAMLMTSVPVAFAAPSPELVKRLRADVLAAKSDAGSGVQAASAETTIPVVQSAWYKDVNNVAHFDGYFGSVAGPMYQDVWVMVEFKDDMGMTIGTEEVLANEYVVEGQGSWSASFPIVPAGTVGAEAMVFGTPTTRMTFMPEAFTTPVFHTLAGKDRHLDGSVTFGMLGMATDPILTDLVVSAAEEDMGNFVDVAYGEATSTAQILPGVAAPWLAWGARPNDMEPTLIFKHYSAVEYSTVTAAASTKVPAYGATAYFTGVVKNSAGVPVAGIPVFVLTPSGTIAGQSVSTATGTYSIGVKSSVKTTYTVVSLGDSYLASASAAPITIDPKAYLSTPTAPSAIARGAYFTSTGYLKPRHTAGSYPVVIKAYLKVSGRWVYKKSIKAKASNYSTYSKYTARSYLPTRGYWKLVATHDSTAHYPSTSGVRYVTVR